MSVRKLKEENQTHGTGREWRIL